MGAGAGAADTHTPQGAFAAGDRRLTERGGGAQENTTKERIQDLIQEGSKIRLDKRYTIIVAAC